MTAKEKAEQLVEKYRPYVTGWDCYYDEPLTDKEMLVDMKQCALIAVDEIIYILTEEYYSVSYWEEVKTEINKL